MTPHSVLAPSLFAVALLAAGCSDTPTGPAAAPATGGLVISLTQPCALPGSVEAHAGGTAVVTDPPGACMSTTGAP